MNLLAQLQHIKAFVFDMDGVLTDGSLLIMNDGSFLRTMDIKDGYALQLAIKRGFQVWVITGSNSDAVAKRLAYLGITQFYQKVKDKKTLLLQLMDENKLDKSQVLFMGDDMPDISVMQACGVSSCPKDAAIDVLQVAQYISPYKGGKGCVRDIIEKTLKLQHLWDENTDTSIAAI
jgi:3-deoxy-D-manno-octulosonate 8-phosphate phosphatase (KDO 8-P phosphatase)